MGCHSGIFHRKNIRNLVLKQTPALEPEFMCVLCAAFIFLSSGVFAAVLLDPLVRAGLLVEFGSSFLQAF